MESSGSSDGKESACNAGDLGSILELGRSPGEGHDNSLQYSCLENLHGQRGLAGYSPWGHKELDTTEQLTLPLSVKAYMDVSWIYLHEMSLAQTVVVFKVWILTIL